jgi:PD-(D/E)XK nuclease superfamily protein
MGKYWNENELRASSSAFQWGDITFTKYKTGCLRKIMLQSQQVDAFVAGKYKSLGDINEERHARRLTDLGYKFEREVEFKMPIASVSNVQFSGHCDFLVRLDGHTRIDECKSVQSTNVRREVIKKGDYLVENLAQVISYMVAAQCHSGQLIYTFYEQNDDSGEMEAADERIFKVQIDLYGRINVDGVPTQFTVMDFIAHSVRAAKVIENKTVDVRPNLWDAPFASPCKMCVFSKACDRWDSGEIESTDAFVEYAKTLVMEGKEND